MAVVDEATSRRIQTDREADGDPMTAATSTGSTARMACGGSAAICRFQTRAAAFRLEVPPSDLSGGPAIIPVSKVSRSNAVLGDRTFGRVRRG